MKERDEITTNGRAVFYTVLYPEFRQKALDLGYTLALHGSMARDMDMIAVAWVKEAKSPDELVRAFSDCIGGTVWKNHHFKNKALMPHNRIAYTLSIFSDWFIDLSIIPPENYDFKLPNDINYSDANFDEMQRVLKNI